MLRALAASTRSCVFDEDTPGALERLRPDVWVKGGDYARRDLPEAAVLARWGGRVASCPYLDGPLHHPLIEEVAAACQR